jgi:hypothetical protein
MDYDNCSCPPVRTDSILFTVILKTLFLLALISALAVAAAPAIGIVTASGHFTLDRSQVWGNATVFEGSIVETSSASSEVALRTGAKLQLAKDSRARILSDRIVMEKGIGQMSAPESFEVNAANLRIHTGGRLRVQVGDGVQIASLVGITRVSSASGILLAAIPAGRAMNFTPQAASGTVTRTGCLLYKANHYIMQDENTQEVVELSGGQNLNTQLGNRVEITGAASSVKPAVSIATLVVNVATLTPKSSGGCLSVAATLSAQTEITAPASGPAEAAAQTSSGGGGMSTGAKVAIIGGIAAGGVVAAVVLASSKKSSTSP